jgi:hypothetical protein
MVRSSNTAWSRVLSYGQKVIARLAKTLAGGARGGQRPSRVRST